MRWLHSFLLVLIFILAGLAPAEDYRLTLSGSEKDIAGAKALLVYGSGLKKGDRIVEVGFGALSGPHPCQVAIGAGSGEEYALGGSGKVEGFPGKVLLSAGRPSGRALSGAITVALAGGEAASSGFFGRIAQFGTSLPGLIIIGGAVVLVIIGLKLRARNSDPLYVPSSRRRTFEDALRDIHARLEEIDANQKDLVKKPPMLRSFKRQIDGFEERLERMEAADRAFQSVQTKHQETLSSVDARLSELRAHAAEDERMTSGLVSALDATKAALGQLSGKADAAEKSSRESSSRSAELMMALSKQDEELQSRLFVLQESQKKVDEALGDLGTGIASLQERAATLEQSGAKHSIAFSELGKLLDGVQGSVAGLAARKIEFPDPTPAIVGLGAKVDAVQKAVAGTEQLKKEVVTLIEAQTRLGERFEEVRSQIEALPKNDFEHELVGLRAEQAKHGEMIAALSASLTDFADDGIEEQIKALADQQAAFASDVQSLVAQGQAAGIAGLATELKSMESALAKSLAEVAETAARIERDSVKKADGLEAQILDLSARLDQRAETVQAIASQVKDQSKKGVEVIDFSPMIGDLRHEVQRIAVDQAKLGDSIGQLSESLSAIANQRPEPVEQIDMTPALDGIAQQLRSIRDEQAKLGVTTVELTRAVSDRTAGADSLAIAAKQDELSPQIAANQPSSPEKSVLLKLVEKEAKAEPAPAIFDVKESQKVARQESAPKAEAEQATDDGSLGWAKSVMTNLLASDAPANSKWSGQGGSAARQWSVSVDQSLAFEASEDPMKPLTPTETPSVDFELGAMIFAAGRVIYGHGDTLRGFWPGKGAASASLSSPLGTEAWRLAAFENAVFCLEEDQVEIINLTSWTRQSKFAGRYVGQASTATHWAGLLVQGDETAIDFREATGKQAGKPIKIGAKSDDIRCMLSDGNAIYVGTNSGRIFKVQESEVFEFQTTFSDGFELASACVWKNSLVLVGHNDAKTSVFACDLDGKIQGQLELECRKLFENPVLIGDSLYLADTDAHELLSISLSKFEVSATLPLPSERVATFSGVAGKDGEALLLTLIEGETHAGRVVQMDPKTGESMIVCRVNHEHVNVIASNGRIVVATGCSYQNMVRVFDPGSTAKEVGKAA